MLWNTTYLEASRHELDDAGRAVSPNLLRHLSPLGWQHINLTGDYLWTYPGTAPDKLRPLRSLFGASAPARA